MFTGVSKPPFFFPKLKKCKRTTKRATRKITEIMIVKIKMKDTTTPIYFEEVESHFLEGNTLALLFKDNVVRNFPMIHIFYYETQQDRVRLKTPSETSSNL